MVPIGPNIHQFGMDILAANFLMGTGAILSLASTHWAGGDMGICIGAGNNILPHAPNWVKDSILTPGLALNWGRDFILTPGLALNWGKNLILTPGLALNWGKNLILTPGLALNWGRDFILTPGLALNWGKNLILTPGLALNWGRDFTLTRCPGLAAQMVALHVCPKH